MEGFLHFGIDIRTAPMDFGHIHNRPTQTEKAVAVLLLYYAAL